MKKPITQKAFGDLLGVSNQAIGQLVTRGVCPIRKDGLINVDKAVAALAKNLSPHSKVAKAIAVAAGQAPHRPGPMKEVAKHLAAFHEAKDRRTVAETFLAEVKLGLARGELVDVAGAQSKAFTAGRALRDALLNCPQRLGARVAPLQTAAEVEAVLLAEFGILLQQWATDIERLFGVKIPSELIAMPAAQAQA